MDLVAITTTHETTATVRNAATASALIRVTTEASDPTEAPRENALTKAAAVAAAVATRAMETRSIRTTKAMAVTNATSTVLDGVAIRTRREAGTAVTVVTVEHRRGAVLEADLRTEVSIVTLPKPRTSE